MASLRVEVEQLPGLRLERCRSDAEAWAVALIADAGLQSPEVNRAAAGEEADLSWPAARLIVELDGPDYHVLRDADIRKMKAWRAAGFDVQRLPTPAVYSEPERLLAMVPGAERRSCPLLRWDDRRSAPFRRQRDNRRPAGVDGTLGALPDASAYGTSARAASRMMSRPS